MSHCSFCTFPYTPPYIIRCKYVRVFSYLSCTLMLANSLHVRCFHRAQYFQALLYLNTWRYHLTQCSNYMTVPSRIVLHAIKVCVWSSVKIFKSLHCIIYSYLYSSNFACLTCLFSSKIWCSSEKLKNCQKGSLSSYQILLSTIKDTPTKFQERLKITVLHNKLITRVIRVLLRGPFKSCARRSYDYVIAFCFGPKKKKLWLDKPVMCTV